MSESRQLEEALRANIQHFYEALRWGGVELDVRAEQLQYMLQGLEQRLAQEETVSLQLTQTQENLPLYTLLQTGKGALRVAQEMGSLPLQPELRETGESPQQAPLTLLLSPDGHETRRRSIDRGYREKRGRRYSRRRRVPRRMTARRI
jgi:hypothetical protein